MERCKSKDPKTKETCNGLLRPFGMKKYGYYKCGSCGELYVFIEKPVDEKQSRLEFK
jgi:hypothetical protein